MTDAGGVLGLEVRHERRARAGQLIGRDTRDGRVQAVGRLAGVGDRLGGREAVRKEQLHLGVIAEYRDLVLDQLAAVLADEAADHDGVGVLRCDALEEGLVVGAGLRVVGRVAEDLDAELLGGVLEVRRHTGAVGLLVVQDVDRLHAETLSGLGKRRALEVVRGDDAGVVPRGGRVVLARLGRDLGALGQSGPRVGRAHHGDRARLGLVQHRDLELRATGVERADVRDDRRILSVRVGVRRACRRVPRSGLRRRVVAGLEGDGVLAGLPTGLLEDHLDRLVHLRRLVRRRSVERQIRRDQELATRVHHRLARGGVDRRRGTPSSSGPAARTVVAARTASAGCGGG